MQTLLNVTKDLISKAGLIVNPGANPNTVNRKSEGVISVAIQGSDSFDVTEVNEATLRFGPALASPAHDLTDPMVYADHLQDVNGDGFTDLVSHYRTKETEIADGDTQACLTGMNLSSGPIGGCDSIITVPRRKN